MDRNKSRQKQRTVTTDPVANGRRRLLKWLGVGSATVLLAEIGWITTSFLRPRRAPGGERELSVITAGAVRDFAPGTVTAFPEGAFYLACLEGGGFLALARKCTHLGCTLPWSAKEGRFNCPCHASSFDIAGRVLTPPATRPLDYYPVRIENGVVKVETGNPMRRSSFEPSQVTGA